MNEGLFQKYCRKAGPMQDIHLAYTNKQDIRISGVRNIFDKIEIDFTGNFIEEKTIYADLSNSTVIKTRLNGIEGTLFLKNDIVFADLIMEI